MDNDIKSIIWYASLVVSLKNGFIASDDKMLATVVADDLFMLEEYIVKVMGISGDSVTPDDILSIHNKLTMM